MKSTEAENTYRVILTIAFVAVCAITAVNHELWRDEANSWLIARESASFLEVFNHARYKGHPYLWEALLLPVAGISSSPAAMQIFSLIIAAAAVWVFLRYSPFSLLHKTLFVFGLFPVYEYSVVARPYGLLLLLLFVFCALFHKRNERFLTICLVVFLLSNSHALGFILGAACGGLLLFDVVFTNGFRAGGFRNPTARQYAGLALIALGITAGFLSVLQGFESRYFGSQLVSILKGESNRPSGSGAASKPENTSKPQLTAPRLKQGTASPAASIESIADDADQLPRLQQAAAHLGKKVGRIFTAYPAAFLPIPKRHLRALLGSKSYKSVAEVLRRIQIPLLLLVAYLTFLLYTVIRKSPHALFFWLLATTGLAVLFGFIHYGSLRHHGFFFIVLMMSLWLLRVTGENVTGESRKERLKSFNAALTVILSLHVVAGATAVVADNAFPFSHGKATAEFISREIPADTPILAYPSVFADSITLYRGKGSTMFYPEYNRGEGKKTFFYDFAPTTLTTRDMPMNSALDRAKRLAAEEKQTILLILIQRFDEKAAERHGLSEKAKFTGAIRAQENFYLYTMPAPDD